MKTMKKILALILALSMVFALGACAKKPAAEKTDAEYITDKGEMIIGITLFAPMNYYDEKNELIGFETGFAKAVCEKLGVNAKFQEISWAAKETELNGKTIDCIWNGMTITDEALANASVSDPYVINAQVVVMKNDVLANYADAASLVDLTFAVENGSAGQKAAEAIDAFIQKQ